MPYIKQYLRQDYDNLVKPLVEQMDHDNFPPGVITYVIYKIILAFFMNKPSYQTIAEIRGIMTGTEHEFNRRIADDYEDSKIKENGDVEI